MKKTNFFIVIVVIFFVIVSACGQKDASDTLEKIEQPIFKSAVVHDPSVIKTEDNYYIVGSHLQMAKSLDLMSWESVSKSVPTTKLFEDVYTEFAEEFAYAKTDTMWAPDIIQLTDGRFYLY